MKDNVAQLGVKSVDLALLHVRPQCSTPRPLFASGFHTHPQPWCVPSFKLLLRLQHPCDRPGMAESSIDNVLWTAMQTVQKMGATSH